MGEKQAENPCKDWMLEKLWGELNRLDKCKNFKGFLDHFIKNHEVYKKMYDSSNPQDFELLAPWNTKLDKL
jgi:hypothetical protein